MPSGIPNVVDGNVQNDEDQGPFNPGLDENIKARVLPNFERSNYELRKLNKLSQARALLGNKPLNRVFLDIQGRPQSLEQFCGND